MRHGLALASLVLLAGFAFPGCQPVPTGIRVLTCGPGVLTGIEIPAARGGTISLRVGERRQIEVMVGKPLYRPEVGCENDFEPPAFLRVDWSWRAPVIDVQLLACPCVVAGRQETIHRQVIVEADNSGTGIYRFEITAVETGVATLAVTGHERECWGCVPVASARVHFEVVP